LVKTNYRLNTVFAGILPVPFKKHLSFSALREILSDQFAKVVDWRQSEKVDYTLHDYPLHSEEEGRAPDPSEGIDDPETI
jgi:hypothetical protein